MVKKRNGKPRLIGNVPIILTPEDKQKRIDLLRGSIIVGNDNKNTHKELKELANQNINISYKTPGDLYNDLKNSTQILKTSNATDNVHKHIYNIINYLRYYRFISREKYHKYINDI